MKVTAVVCTRDRYFSTLPLCLSAIAMQTHKPVELLIYDDGEHIDVRNVSPYNGLFPLLLSKGIDYKVIFTNAGQVDGHRKAISDAKGDFIWRVDDDEVPEPNVLESLLSNMVDGVGAVGGLVIDPNTGGGKSDLASNAIEDIHLGVNKQWFKHEGKSEVDHLYSSFVYRKEAAKPEYYAKLSRVGHREETIFTYSMKHAGWKLVLDPSVITWHLRNPKGGIRSEENLNLWNQDEQRFNAKLAEWKIEPKQYTFMVLECGLGDHLVFKSILNDVRKKYNNIVLAVCYPEVFEDDKDIKLISIAEAKARMNIEEHNVYKHMWDKNWKGPLANAYKELYHV